MPYVLVRHKLKNFKKWKPMYDAHGTIRKAGGSKGGRLFRNVDQPKEVVILLKWNRLDRARKFAKSRDLRATMKRAGVVGKPEIHFLEEVGQARA
jgi:heme-degrading monooxygenase HmoA